MQLSILKKQIVEVKIRVPTLYIPALKVQAYSNGYESIDSRRQITIRQSLSL